MCFPTSRSMLTPRRSPNTVNLQDIRPISTKRKLNLDFYQVLSLKGLRKHPHVESLSLRGSMITSFEGFDALPNLSSINLNDTPVSKHKNCLLSLVILLPSLKIYNGRLIPKSVQEKAATYPSIAKKLINAGWIAVWPCPDQEALNHLEDVYIGSNSGVQNDTELFSDLPSEELPASEPYIAESANSCSADASIGDSTFIGGRTFEEVYQSNTRRYEKMVSSFLDVSYEPSQELSLIDQVSGVMAEKGIYGSPAQLLMSIEERLSQ